MELQRLLFEPALVRSTPNIIRWWESRRLAYNFVVGTCGLLTLGYTSVIGFLAQGKWMVAPWQIVVVYGLAANVCYTLGPAIEVLAQRWLGRQVYGLGPALFRYGLAFAVGLTLFPNAIITVLAIVSRMFR
jgi:hypothetical protein